MKNPEIQRSFGGKIYKTKEMEIIAKKTINSDLSPFQVSILYKFEENYFIYDFSEDPPDEAYEEFKKLGLTDYDKSLITENGMEDEELELFDKEFSEYSAKRLCESRYLKCDYEKHFRKGWRERQAGTWEKFMTYSGKNS